MAGASADSGRGDATVGGDWEVLGDDTVAYEGFLRVVHRRLRLPRGHEATWELIDIPATVSVLAFTPDDDVVMVRQFRPGPARQVISLPGGLIDPGETPAAAGLRELVEETGYVAETSEEIAAIHLNNFTRPAHVVVARDARPTGAQQLDQHEDCQVLVMSLAEMRAALRAGELGAGLQTYQALDRLGLL